MSTRTSGDGEYLEYRIEEPLGRGGMGVVYAAHDTRLKRKVALKLMAPELALDERYRERFERESELAMSLEHPNVVPIHDAGEAEGRLYLAMRCVEGTDLRALLREHGPLERDRAVAIVAQIAHALDAAHAKGLVHRDVKPSNVLLDESEHAYLADFGLTRRLPETPALRADSLSVGTPAYLAPEQIEGGEIDGRVDVYSLGCLLYECLTGEPPFVADSRLAVAWSHLEQEPPRASERNALLPKALDAVIAKAMAKDPEERYASCGELVAAAEEAMGIGRRARTGRRRIVAASAGAAVVATAVAVAIAARGETPASSAAFAVSPNTLVRVDPRSNEIAAVIPVGDSPSDTAVAGNSVWVYNVGDRTVTEIDPRTNHVRHTTKISTTAADLTVGNGPLLAADAGGAWLVGYDVQREEYVLTRIDAGGGGKHEYPAGKESLDAVAVHAGAVWVLASRASRGYVWRIDPETGRVLSRVPVPRGVFGPEGQGLAVGGGFIWLSNAREGKLYRLDPATGDTGHTRLGAFIMRPVFGFGHVWTCAWDGERGRMVRVDARTLQNDLSRDALPAEQGHFAVGYGSVWRHDVPSGTLMRFRPRNGEPAGLIPLLRDDGRHDPYLAVTSIATGADGVWLSVSSA